MERKNKNIIVLSDGTGQDGGKGHDSNVYKLFRMLEDRTDKQVVFYDEGLGTEAQRVAGMAFGAGFTNNILQCYRFIFDNYQAGDKIFLFGFSRGAATVRSLASFIHYFGILPNSRPELIEQAYRIYKNRKRSYDKSGFRSEPKGPFKFVNRIFQGVHDVRQHDLDDKYGKSAEFVRLHPNQWVKIEFLGVWDTVPSLGLPAIPGLDILIDRIPAWKHQYHNFKLRASVKHACHALSIDDNRRWFFPSIWKEYDPGGGDNQKVEQVWFSGSHTDVGGGFPEAGFSDIALEWMVQKAFEHGLRLYFDNRDNWNFCIAPDALDAFHDPRSGAGFIYPEALRDQIWDDAAQTTFGPLRIHETVLERARVYAPQQKRTPPGFDPRSKPGQPQVVEYDPWILRSYPDPEQIDELMRRRYQDDMARVHARLLMKTQSLENWMAEPENSYEAWLAKNHYVFEEFTLNGRKLKVLVERARSIVQNMYDPDGAHLVLRKRDLDQLGKEKPGVKALVFRDYDKDDPLDQLSASPDYKRLRERARIIDPKLKRITRAQRKAWAENPHTIPYVYRIDWDCERWTSIKPKTTAGEGSADKVS